ncbi:MAG TPA: helix-turn-helix transcriptional regulator [Streptosporangiaceae bacterium]|nr:helix-turn-helix transcriptional regulator [Streptosporangiaceae bacterium]
MQIYTIVMNGAATLLLIALAAKLGKAAWRAPRGPFRAASAAGAAVCLLLAISSLERFGVHAAQARLIASGWLRWLLEPLAAAQATLAVLVGICALVLILRHWNHLGRAQSMVHVLTERVPSKAHATQARLSARENEVLGLIRSGVLSDGEIAGALHISPATAATHVQRILRKTDLHNRRDLMLLPRARSAA